MLPTILLLFVSHHPIVRATALVDQLGARSYAARERAAKELLGFSRVGQWAVRGGLAHADPEVAERCRRLLPELVAETRRARLARLRDLLVKAPTTPLPSDEPLMRRFLAITSDSAHARSLYFEMYERHSGLLDAVELSDSKAAGQLFWQYVDAVLMYPDGRTVVNLLEQVSPRSEVALFWFLSSNPDLRPFPIAGSNRTDFPYFGSRYALTHLTGSDASPAMRYLLMAWLAGPRNVEDEKVEARMYAAALRLADAARIKDPGRHAARDRE